MDRTKRTRRNRPPLVAGSARQSTPPAPHLRAAIGAAVIVAMLATAAVAAASTVTYRAGPLTATMKAGTHNPTCKQKWPVTVTAKFKGKRTHATAVYQFLLASQVVSTQYPFGLTPRNPQNTIFHFYGSFTDNTFGPFGALSVGQHLTVRVVVKVSHYTAYPSYPVTVVQASGCPSK
jgi:hypothetical protein